MAIDQALGGLYRAGRSCMQVGCTDFFKVERSTVAKWEAREQNATDMGFMQLFTLRMWMIPRKSLGPIPKDVIVDAESAFRSDFVSAPIETSALILTKRRSRRRSRAPSERHRRHLVPGLARPLWLRRNAPLVDRAQLSRASASSNQ